MVMKMTNCNPTQLDQVPQCSNIDIYHLSNIDRTPKWPNNTLPTTAGIDGGGGACLTHANFLIAGT
jgi:hypothetical protein